MNWGNIRANWGKKPVVKHLTCACYPQPHPRHPTTSLSPLTEGKRRSSCVNDVLRPAGPRIRKTGPAYLPDPSLFHAGRGVETHPAWSEEHGTVSSRALCITERPQKRGTSLIKPQQPLSYPSYTAAARGWGLHAVVDRGCRVPGRNSKSVKPETTGIRPRS